MIFDINLSAATDDVFTALFTIELFITFVAHAFLLYFQASLALFLLPSRCRSNTPAPGETRRRACTLT